MKFAGAYASDREADEAGFFPFSDLITTVMLIAISLGIGWILWIFIRG